MAHIEKRTTKTGIRYDAVYRDPRGRERSKTFETKRDAQRHLHEVEADKGRGAWRDPRLGRITFGAWVEHYLEGAVHKRRSTLEKDRSALRCHLLPALGSRALDSITPLDVQRVVQGLDKRLGPATVRTVYGVLCAVFSAAVDADVIAVSPCRGVKLRQNARREIRFLSVDELHRLADAVPAEYRPMVYLGGVLGLRWSEIAGLRVGRVDFLRHTLEVTETFTAKGGAGRYEDVKTPSSRRTLVVPGFLLDLLAAHLAARGRPASDTPFFTSPHGGPLLHPNFRRRVWEPAVRHAGLEGLTFHELRHSAVGLMIEAGAHIEAIKQRMGHSSIATTSDVYGHVLPSVEESVTGRLEDLLGSRDNRGMNDRTLSLTTL